MTIVKDGDRVAGVWPYSIEQKVGVSLLRTPVLTPYLGPHVFYPANLKQSKYDSYEHEILSALFDQMPQIKVWFIAIQPELKQVGLFKQKGFDTQVRQTFIINLLNDEETLFSKLHEESRRNVRKSEEDIVITNEPELLSQLFNFQKATLDKKNVQVNFSLQYLERLFNACKEKGQAALWVAKKDGIIQAIIWNLWDEQRAYYLMGAKNPEIRDNRAMTALIWHSIKHCKAIGKKTFDFEGSMDAGVERFFRCFGGKREIYLVLKKNKSLIWRSVQMVKGK